VPAGHGLAAAVGVAVEVELGVEVEVELAVGVEVELAVGVEVEVEVGVGVALEVAVAVAVGTVAAWLCTLNWLTTRSGSGGPTGVLVGVGVGEPTSRIGANSVKWVVEPVTVLDAASTVDGSACQVVPLKNERLLGGAPL
jgi:hypothetical protein